RARSSRPRASPRVPAESGSGLDDPPSGRDAVQSIAGVDNQRGLRGDPGPVVGRVVGDDNETILTPEVIGRQLLAGHPKVGMAPGRGEDWDVGVVVADDGSPGYE